MNKLMKNYNKAIQEIYDHVGFTPDWVVCPIDDATSYYWNVDTEVVRFAQTKKELKSESGDYYEDDIYKQRFYKNWVYEGKDITMIMCDPHVDEVQWFRIFDNKKRVK